MANKKVVVAGATGLVGNAALRHFGEVGGAKSSRCRGASRASSTAPAMFRSI